MNELSVDLQYVLRAKTLANNLIWLASFGCEIVNTPDIISVTHPDIPDYNAHMIVGWIAGTHNRFKSLLENEASPTLYIDEPFIGDASPLLSRYQLQPTFSSRVKCTQLKSKGRAPTAFMLRRAESSEIDRWSNLYSLGFGREESLSVDRKRWTQSFANSALSHWFFTERGQEIGVMQTCNAEDVVGIYSVTFKSEYRGMRKIIAVAKTLPAELWAQGARTIYFERVKRKVWTPRTRAPLFREFKTVRKFLVYTKH